MAMASSFSLRLKFIALFVLLIAGLIILKLYLLQIVNGSDYRDKAERQYQQPSEKIFDRGAISFQNKDGSLFGAAAIKSGFILSINPKILENPEAAYAKISQIIALDKNNFLSKAAKKTDLYKEIQKRLDETAADKIVSLKIPGVSIYKERWRFYPGKEMASQVLGFVGSDGNTLAGRYGLEKYYDDILARNTDDAYTNFFAELFTNIKKVAANGQNLEGDIVSSIEPTTQNFLERSVKEIVKRWNAKSAGAIVIDPKTGDIYAMAVSPGFDPNNFQTEKNQAVFRNPIVEDVYEMGSIIKPLTIAAGIDTGAITADSRYTDNGFLDIADKRIWNFDKKGRGLVDIQTVLDDSLNTGAAYVALKLGKKVFSDYMLGYGIGEETGIDLPNETHGLVSGLKKGGDVEVATASFGQGIAITPIETARALSVLGNGGLLITPHVVKRIDYRLGFSKTIINTEQENKRIIKKETSEEITKMLVTVVDKALLGGTVKMARYSIAAKTGTAQLVKSAGGGYYSDRFLHSFFGYFPAYNPRFLVFLYTVDPKGEIYASHTLTMPFISIAKFLINYFEIPPDR
jgi:cell division protein FtsI/penicillin-binding protein 2